MRFFYWLLLPVGLVSLCLFLPLSANGQLAPTIFTYTPDEYYTRDQLYIGGQLGVGYLFGLRQKRHNHNHRYYVFSRLQLGFSTNYYRKNNPEARRESGTAYRFAATLNFRFLRNIRLYENPLELSERMQWSFIASADVLAGLSPNNSNFFIDASYTAKVYYNTGYHRKLGNAVGRFNVKAGDLKRQYYAGLFWQNDRFLLDKVFGTNIRSDHGETQAFGIYATWYREGIHEEHIYDDVAISAGYSERMITDRRIYIEHKDNQSAYGRYAVLEDSLTNAFHYYQTGNLGIYHAWGTVNFNIGIDDLLAGRDVQRFGHQGQQHLNKSKRNWVTRKSKGSQSPLFPWERAKEFYEKPRTLAQMNVMLHSPFLFSSFKFK